MADSFTTALALRKQETGGNSDSWGTKLNDEAIQYIEDKIVGTTSISTTGGTTTITDSQGRSNVIKVTGVLASNAVITVPNESHSWYVQNATTDGGFAVLVQTAGGTAHQIATIPSGTLKKVYCDAADGVFRTDDNLIGTVVLLPFGLTIPAGLHEVEVVITTNVSRTGKYRELFRLYGTTYGVGDGATTFTRPWQLTATNLSWAPFNQGKVCLYL